jgi:hypothetical protein
LLPSHAKQGGDQSTAGLGVQLLDGAKSQRLEILEDAFERALLLGEIRLRERLFKQRKLLQKAVGSIGRIFPPFAARR